MEDCRFFGFLSRSEGIEIGPGNLEEGCWRVCLFWWGREKGCLPPSVEKVRGGVVDGMIGE